MFRIMKNPFATKYVAPGVLDWVGDKEDSLPSILRRCEAFHFRGVILGPHGTGKSTLLEHLMPRIGHVKFRREPDGTVRQPDEIAGGARRKPEVVWLRLRNGPDCRAAILWECIRSVGQSGDIVVVDGWEQISHAGRAILQWKTKARSMGLIATTHCRSHLPFSLPILYQTRVTPQLATQLVRAISPEFVAKSSADQMLRHITQRLELQNGNFREVLMDLYDQFQATSR